ncbi:hypothetical protein J6590_067021 [Homalodisca vitripennis]|nr:hypothetical protein J6590_067021 [Homalodisca vitripennis]
MHFIFLTLMVSPFWSNQRFTVFRPRSATLYTSGQLDPSKQRAVSSAGNPVNPRGGAPPEFGDTPKNIILSEGNQPEGRVHCEVTIINNKLSHGRDSTG